MAGFFLTGNGQGGGIQLPINADQVNLNPKIPDINSTNVQDTLEEIVDKLDGYVHKGKDSDVIGGENLIVNGYILNEPIASIDNTTSTEVAQNDFCWFATDELRIPQDTIIGSVIIGLDETTVKEGDKVTGINIAVVNSTTRAVEYIVKNGIGYAHKNELHKDIMQSDIVVTYNVGNKSFTYDADMLIGAKGMKWGDHGGNINSCVGMDENSLPADGDTIRQYTQGDWVGKAIVTFENISLYDLGNKDTNWEDLDYTEVLEYSSDINLFDARKVITKKYYNGNTFAYSKDWDMYVHECEPNDTFRLLKTAHDSTTIAFLDKDNKLVSTTAIRQTDLNGWQKYDITVPSTETIKKLAFNLHIATLGANDYKDTVMLLKGHTHQPTTVIPYTSEAHVVIDGNEVNTTFDNSKTSLFSQYIDEAIVELDNKKVDKIPFTGLNVFDNYRNIWNATYFRIPSLLRTHDGSLLAFSDIRYNTPNDQSYIDIGCARSVDDGATWDYQTAMKNNDVSPARSRVMDATSLQTRSGKIIVLAGGWDTNPNNWTTYNGMPDADWNPYIVTSTNDGSTWSQKVSLKDASVCANQPQGTIAWLGGVGNGIEMSNGTIIFPIQICYFQTVTNGVGSNKVTRSGLIYSTDDGDTWRMSDSFVVGTENMIVEVGNKLIMNARNGNYRAAYYTEDLGATWKEYAPLHNHILNRANGCQGSFIAFDTIAGHRVGLVSTAKNLKGGYIRDNITIYMIDFDNPNGGVVELLVPYPYDGNSLGGGYSSLAYGKTKSGQRKLDIIFEHHGRISYKDVTFLLDEIENIVQLSVKRNVKWTDLEHVTETYTFENLFNHKDVVKFVNTGAVQANGGVGTGNSWTRVMIPVTGGKTYYIHSKRSEANNTPGNILGSSDFVFYQTNDNTFNTTTRIGNTRITSTIQINGKNVIQVTPTANTTHLAFNINNSTNFADAQDEFMVWESTQSMPQTYVADKVVDKVIIDGSKVDTTFDSQTGLVSETVREALDELNRKIGNNIGGGIGTVTQVNGQIPNHDGHVELRGGATQNTIDEKIVISAGNVQDFATIDCMLQDDVNEIKALFV